MRWRSVEARRRRTTLVWLLSRAADRRPPFAPRYGPAGGPWGVYAVIVSRCGSFMGDCGRCGVDTRGGALALMLVDLGKGGITYTLQ